MAVDLLGRLKEFNSTYKDIISVSDKKSLYGKITVPKRSGKLREIYFPNDELKESMMCFRDILINELRCFHDVDIDEIRLNLFKMRAGSMFRIDKCEVLNHIKALYNLNDNIIYEMRKSIEIAFVNINGVGLYIHTPTRGVIAGIMTIPICSDIEKELPLSLLLN